MLRELWQSFVPILQVFLALLLYTAVFSVLGFFLFRHVGASGGSLGSR